MTDGMDDKQVRRYVAAFADGELDVEQSLRVLERMAMDPQTTWRVRHQQQLRQRVARVMREPGAAPTALRAELTRMAQTEPSPTRVATGRTVLRRIGRWAPVGVAAMLLVGTIMALGAGWRPGASFTSERHVRGGGGGAVPTVLTAAQVDRFGARHVRCARDIDAMMNVAKFPRQVEALPGRVAEYLGQPLGAATFDLSAAGYAYVQAGECHIPAGRAVHVMYRATGAGRSDALSLWIAPHDGRLDVAEGRLYVAAGAGAPHPLVLWRRGGLVYYLAGDGMEQVDRAAQHLREGMGQAEGAGTGAGCG